MDLKTEVAKVFETHMGSDDPYFNIVVNRVEQFIGRREPSDKVMFDYLEQLTNGLDFNADALVADLMELKKDYVEMVTAQRQKPQRRQKGGRTTYVPLLTVKGPRR
jgi:hypothetical protein